MGSRMQVFTAIVWVLVRKIRLSAHNVSRYTPEGGGETMTIVYNTQLHLILHRTIGRICRTVGRIGC